MSNPANAIEQISDSLVLRSATPEDADQLFDFHEEVFIDEESGTRAWWIAEWGKDLITKPHPTFSPADCLIVEDTQNNTIASSTLYLTQEWQTDSVSFNVGRPEIVGTRKPYRNQGLIRKQFNVMHQWAEQRGHDITVVNGIPHYYRQFGYDMAINDLADRQNRLEAFPRWKPDEQRPYVLRDPTPDDIPFITQLLNQSADRSLYNPVFKNDEVSYIVFDRSQRSGARWKFAILCRNSADRPAEPIGVIAYTLVIAIDQGTITRIEMAQPKYWRLATGALLREFEERARNEGENQPDPERSIKTIKTELQNNHPAYIFDEGALGPEPNNTYAWYVRVPQLPRFIHKLAPALSRRLDESPHAGYDGPVTIQLGKHSIRLRFNNGKCEQVTGETGTDRRDANASFPNGNFNQILFGWRTVNDIIRTDADASIKSKADAHLLQTLFPHKTSDLSLTLT